MVWIAVIRYNGEHHAPPVIDELITETSIAVSRGRAELDTHGYGWSQVALTCVGRAGLRTGQIVEVHDELQGASWRGKIVGIEHSRDGATPLVSLDILKPTINVAFGG